MKIKTRIFLIAIVFLNMIISSCEDNINKKLKLADDCLNKSHVDSAYNIIKNIDPKKLNDKQNIALYTLLYNKAKYKKSIPVNDSSIDSAISYYSSHYSADRLADAYNYKGMTLYLDQRKTDEAIECLKKAEIIVVKYDIKQLEQRTFENICIVNMGSHNYEIALKYGLKALDYAYEIKDTAGIAYDLQYISDTYSALKMDNKAMVYYLKSLSYLKYYDKLSQSILFGNIGEYYFEKGNSRTAELYIKKAFQKNPTAYTYAIAADRYIITGKYDRARELMAKAPIPINNIEKHKQLTTLYNLYRKTGYQNYALNIADSIFLLNQKMRNSQKHDNITDIQMQYDKKLVAQTFKSRMIYMSEGLAILAILSILLILRQKYKTSKSRQTIMQDRLIINEYKGKLAEMKSSNNSSAAQIEEMNKMIESLETKILKALNNGKQCYELVNNNGNTIRWSTKDFRDFVEYYKLVNFSYVASLQEKYNNLTPNQIFFMITTNSMNKDEATVANIMSISNNAMRSMKSRIKAKSVDRSK